MRPLALVGPELQVQMGQLRPLRALRVVAEVALASTRLALDSLEVQAQILLRQADCVPLLAERLEPLARHPLEVPVASGKLERRAALAAAVEDLEAPASLVEPEALASLVPVAEVVLAQSARPPALAVLAVMDFARSSFSDHEPTHRTR